MIFFVTVACTDYAKAINTLIISLWKGDDQLRSKHIDVYGLGVNLFSLLWALSATCFNLCVVSMCVELFLFIPMSLTLTYFQGHVLVIKQKTQNVVVFYCPVLIASRLDWALPHCVLFRLAMERRLIDRLTFFTMIYVLVW